MSAQSTHQNARRYRRSAHAALSILPLFFFIVLPAPSQNTSEPPSRALVTFYSNHVTILGGTVGHRWGAFKGRLFDHDNQLTFMEPGRFITFQVSPGVHVFTANSWMSRHANHGKHVTVDVSAGRRYFIETGSFAGEPVFGIRFVNCQFARSEGASLKPLEAVHIRPAGKSIAVFETSFPSCPTDNSQP